MADVFQRCAYELAEALGYAIGNESRSWRELLDEVRKGREESRLWRPQLAEARDRAHKLASPRQAELNQAELDTMEAETGLANVEAAAKIRGRRHRDEVALLEAEIAALRERIAEFEGQAVKSATPSLSGS